MINLEQFKKDKIAINTRTQEEYDSLMRFFDSKGIEWRGEKKATEDYNEVRWGDFFIYLNYKDYRYNDPSDKGEITCSNRVYSFKKDHKIITPNQLQEYNEFMGKSKVKIIKTKEDLKNIHIKIPENLKIEEWNKIVRKFKRLGLYIHNKPKIKGKDNNYSNYAYAIQKDYSNRLSMEYANRFINITPEWCGTLNCIKEISVEDFLREEETQYLNIGEAINWMLESKDNVIEYEDDDYASNRTKYKGRICSEGFLEINFNGWNVHKISVQRLFTTLKKIRKYTKKSLKDLIENKEPFQYKNNWYRFNKDSAIIDSKGSAMGIELIKELLTKTN
jgi:hypothetical protein